MIFSAFPIRLLQLSTAGEVFLEGTCPLSRCPQTAKLPAPCFRRTEKVGEKSDSFSRAERTRPLRPVSRLQLLDFENIPVECFQRILPLLNSRTRHAVSLQAYGKHHEKISHPPCFLLNRRAPNHILRRTPCAGIFLFEKMLPPADFFEKTLAISFWLCYNTSI